MPAPASVTRGMASAANPGPIVGILLAAGRSRRASGNKLLYRLASGQVMALESAQRLGSAVDEVLAVVRSEDVELPGLLGEEGIDCRPCLTAHLGMGHSLGFGVNQSPQARGWVVALADMPWIRPETIRAVADRLRQGAALVIPTFEGRRGHPVGFSTGYRAELLQLRGDRGGRSIINRHPEAVVEIACEDRGIWLDVDRDEDLQRFADAAYPGP